LEEISQLIRYEMENAHKLSVPLVVDISSGNNWLEAH
jgi:DNA polymerase-1